MADDYNDSMRNRGLPDKPHEFQPQEYARDFCAFQPTPESPRCNLSRMNTMAHTTKLEGCEPTLEPSLEDLAIEAAELLDSLPTYVSDQTIRRAQQIAFALRACTENARVRVSAGVPTVSDGDARTTAAQIVARYYPDDDELESAIREALEATCSRGGLLSSEVAWEVARHIKDNNSAYYSTKEGLAELETIINRHFVAAAASPVAPDDKATPLCPVHQRLEDADALECEIGNDCVACSLNERRELLELIAPFAAEGNTEDSVTVLSRVVEFYKTHVGDNRVIVSYPASAAASDVAPTVDDAEPQHHAKTCDRWVQCGDHVHYEPIVNCSCAAPAPSAAIQDEAPTFRSTKEAMLARKAATEIAPALATSECLWCRAHPHREPCCFQCASARDDKRLRAERVDQITAIIERCLSEGEALTLDDDRE